MRTYRWEITFSFYLSINRWLSSRSSMKTKDEKRYIRCWDTHTWRRLCQKFSKRNESRQILLKRRENQIHSCDYSRLTSVYEKQARERGLLCVRSSVNALLTMIDFSNEILIEIEWKMNIFEEKDFWILTNKDFEKPKREKKGTLTCHDKLTFHLYWEVIKWNKNH